MDITAIIIFLIISLGILYAAYITDKKRLKHKTKQHSSTIQSSLPTTTRKVRGSPRRSG